MDANDVYKELKLRGYEYGPNFQVIIGADIEGIPVYQNKYAQKVTSGGVELKNLNVEFAPRHAIKQIPLLEEYHFVPYQEENILSKSNKRC
ncbi:fatty acid synthase [Trichonephila inaurata madagascariensis]|uniref:Fatty acid synthase n=1 Tax=Trichonephila inaurata madagascariensis TaxID=2747483 RepID=A0A8X6I9K3_9ARAC|nr:fatty acid synthase [Trichonephila inaurata madagascariensis]